MNRDFTFDFDTLRFRSSCRRIYNQQIFEYINRFKDTVWTIFDEYDDVSHHNFRQVEEYFIKNPIKKCYIDRKKQILYIETYNNRVASIKEKYIVTPKQIRG